MNVLRGLNNLQRSGVGGRRAESLRAGTFLTPARSSAAFLSSSSSVEESKDEEHGGLFSSWVGKIKGAFQSKQPATAQSEEQPISTFTLLECANELKTARRLSNFSSFLKITPQNEGAAIESVEKCEKMMRALAKHNPSGQNVDEKQKEAAAKECGCTVRDISTMLTNFEKLKEARTKLQQMKDKGEELPKTMAELQQVMGVSSPKNNLSQSKSGDISRNAPCICGSGKKYKRCCGKGT